jgi:hypothetical protein
MGPHRSAAVLLVLMLTGTPAAAQECRAGDGSGATQTAEGQRRHDAAVQYLARVHAAQQQAHAEGGRYVPLHQLRAVPAPPVGFIPRLVADQWSYAVSLKDLFDPCGFALFSDEHGVVYESVARLIQPGRSHPAGAATLAAP